MIGRSMPGTRKSQKKKIPIKYLRLYRQFKVFYRNAYGKVGFLILLGFVIFTLLTPLIVIQPNYSALAPVLDTSSPSIEYSTNLASQPNISLGSSPLYFIPTSDTNSLGANQLLFSSGSGNLYSFCIDSQNASDNNRLYQVYSQNSSAIKLVVHPVVATLEDCTLLSSGTLQLTNFVILPMSDNSIRVGEMGQTVTTPCQPVFKYLYSLEYNGSLTSCLVTNSLPYRYFLYNNPSYNYAGIGATSQGQFFFVNTYENTTILHDYSIFPEAQLWNDTLSLMGQIGINFLGSGFTVNQYNNFSEVLVYNQTSLYAYNSLNGALVWKTNSSLDLNVSIGVSIPCGQERNYDGNNYGFFVNNSSTVEMVDLMNGNITSLYSGSSVIYSISESDGSNSFPSGVILTTRSSFEILHKNVENAVYNVTASIPADAGHVEGSGTYAGAYNMVYVTTNGYVISVNATATSPADSYFWSLKLPAASFFSSPNLILNGQSGNLQVGVVSSNHALYLVSAIAVDLNPIPPTLTSTTGQAFPLGTEFQGYNVWSEFVGSFYVDWEFGIIIGLYTMGLAILIGMYVGYKGGIGGGIIETISLGIYLTPSLGLLIALTDFFPANQRFVDIILVIGGLSWPFAAFTLMGIVKTVRARTYIEASKMIGSSTFTILRKDVLPNLGPLMLYMLSLSIAGGAGAVSSLQFLGIARITLPTWGGMLSDVLNNFSYAETAPFWVYPPVIALTLFVMSFIFVSRGMDELSNPRLRRR
jgi:peptide/nickel transport system permease protein